MFSYDEINRQLEGQSPSQLKATALLWATDPLRYTDIGYVFTKLYDDFVPEEEVHRITAETAEAKATFLEGLTHDSGGFAFQDKALKARATADYWKQHIEKKYPDGPSQIEAESQTRDNCSPG